MDVKFFLVTAIILLVSAVDIRGVDAEENFTFGDCEPGKESCRDCYLTLVKSLFKNGTNVFNLTRIFLPPIGNPPDSVIVSYQFYNETMDIEEIWFWATTFGYFLHPMAHFQYMSLLFGKPEPLHQQIVNVTLDATECYGVSDDFMLLLTQRLKAYLQEQSITARVDDSYAASAVNKATFNNIIKEYGNDTKYISVIFSLVYPVIIPISLLGIVVPLIILYVCTHKHKFMYTSGRLQRTRFRKLHRQVRAGIMSLAIISFFWVLLILALDGASIHYTKAILPRFNFSNETHNYIFKEIHPGPNDMAVKESTIYHNILYDLPIILCVYDVLFSVAYIAIIVVATVTHFCQADKQQTEHDDRIYHILALTVICPILSLMTHLPFIAIAYLNDANHAGSIFIFLTIVTIVEFLILELSFISFFKLLENTLQVSKTNRFIKSFLVVLVVVVCLFFFFFLIVISGCYFFFLPIVQSISRSSNQVIAIYQTILIFIGALILYKTIFKKTDPLIKALNQKEVGNLISKSATEEWEASNDRDKLISFYSFVIMDVIKNLSKVPAVSRGGVLDSDGQTQMESPLEVTDCW